MIALVLSIFALILGVLWIIFPFMVYSKFGSLERLQRRQIELLEEIAKHSRDGASSSKVPSSVGYFSEPEEGTSTGTIIGVVAVLLVIGVVAILVMKG